MSIPLIITLLHTPYYESILLGEFRIHFIQIVVLTLVIRSITPPPKQRNKSPIDFWIICTCLFLILPVIFRPDSNTAVIFNTKIAITYGLVYAFFRLNIQSISDYQRFAKTIVICLIPLAIEMFLETRTGHNSYSFFDTISPFTIVRNDQIRASGPFSHAILAGTVGATCLFICCSLTEKKWRYAGIVISAITVFACASSGPIGGLVAGVFAMLMRRKRHFIKLMLWSMPFLYVFFDLIMTRNPIYLISYIDFTGGSTSWFRARLIECSFEHLKEWWLFGTNYTRHWMPSGVSFSPEHTDITCHYIQTGVWAGLLPFTSFIMVIISSFKQMSVIIKNVDQSLPNPEWAIGAGLFSLTISITCISMFDNSIVLFFAFTGSIASISSIKSLQGSEVEKQSRISGNGAKNLNT